jgi:hypothetical protein
MARSCFVFCIALFALLFLARGSMAVEQTTLDLLVSYAKQGCLSGKQFDFSANVNGNISFKNPLTPGAEGKTSINIRDAPGAAAIFTEQIRVVADQQIRDCMKPYIDQIFAAVLKEDKSLNK